MSSPIRDEWRSDDGSVRLILGDAMEVLPTLDGLDAAVTDPPYGIAGAGGNSSRAGIKGNYTEAFEDTQEYVKTVCVPIVRMAIERCKRAAVTCGRTNMWHYPPARDVGAFMSPRAVSVSYWGRPTWQPILFYGNAANVGEQLKPLHRLMMDAAPDNGHPCPKPLEPWLWLLMKASKTGECVVDPFMGSGTTAVACLRCERRAVGIEIEKKYWEIAVRRVRAELERFPLFEPAARPRQLELLDADAVSVSVYP
jgi:site-specific DNA-methyltransferase (adenine-specific)